jgi:urea transport system permease protein
MDASGERSRIGLFIAGRSLQRLDFAVFQVVLDLADPRGGVGSVCKWLAAFLGVLALLSSLPAYALDPDMALKLAAGTNSDRIAAVKEVIAAADVSAAPYLEKLIDDHVKVADGKAFVVDGDTVTDPATGQAVALPANAEDVVNSNRVRAELKKGLSVLRLLSPDYAVRLESAKGLRTSDVDKTKLPVNCRLRC